MSTVLEVRLPQDQLKEIAAMVIAGLEGGKANRKPRTVAQAAKELNVSARTVYMRIQAGTIRRVPDIGAIRVPAAEIERLLSEEKSPASLA